MEAPKLISMPKRYLAKLLRPCCHLLPHALWSCATAHDVILFSVVCCRSLRCSILKYIALHHILCFVVLCCSVLAVALCGPEFVKIVPGGVGPCSVVYCYVLYCYAMIIQYVMSYFLSCMF